MAEWPRRWTPTQKVEGPKFSLQPSALRRTPTPITPGHRQSTRHLRSMKAQWLAEAAKCPSGNRQDNTPNVCRAPKHVKLRLPTHTYTNHLPVKYTYTNRITSANLCNTLIKFNRYSGLIADLICGLDACPMTCGFET